MAGDGARWVASALSTESGKQRRNKSGAQRKTLHDYLIRTLVNQHGVSTRGFNESVRTLLERYEEDPGTGNIVYKLIPDAYIISEDKDGWVTIHVWEVEVANPLDESHILRYGKLWGDIDATDCISLQLHLLDRFGRESTVDLFTAWSAYCSLGVSS